jgi:hypothetical protein
LETYQLCASIFFWIVIGYSITDLAAIKAEETGTSIQTEQYESCETDRTLVAGAL